MSLHQSIAAVGQPRDAIATLKSGLKLHYRAYDGSGAPILFLHGLADSSKSFEAVIRSLRHPFSVYALDLRGHGTSDPADSYAISDFADDVIEFIETEITRRVHIVGHSMGAIIAQRVTTLRPDLVSRLVLVGAAPTAAGHRELAGLRQEIAEFGARIPREYIDAFQRGTVSDAVAEAELHGYVDESTLLSAATWLGAIDGLLHEPAEEVREIKVPALVIWGANDGIFGKSAQEALARFLTDHQSITYQNAGHAPHWEDPARVASDIERFLLLPWEG